MDSLLLITNICSPPLAPPSSSSTRTSTSSSSSSLRLPRRFPLLHRRRRRVLGPGRSIGIPPPVATAAARNGALVASSVPPNNGVFTVGDFMTKREELHTVKPTTTVDEALQKLVENRITGFPVIDDDWKLVGVVSDYDLLALDSISGSTAHKGLELDSCTGTGHTDTSLFPEADSTWKTFNEIQRLLSKTNGKVVGELMTPVPLVVRETTNLGDAARLLLETKYRRLPVVDSAGKLVGIITRGNVVRAALEIKRAIEKRSKA